jgi:cobalamin biosynthesis protein CobT
VPITDDWLQKKWSDKMASEDSDHSVKLTLRIHIFWRIGYHMTVSRSNAVDCFDEDEDEDDDEDDDDDDKFHEPEGEDAKRLLRRNS